MVKRPVGHSGIVDTARFQKTKLLVSLAAVAGLFGCGEHVSRDMHARILAIGDSMLAWNKPTNDAIPDVVETLLGEEVVDRSVIGARFLYSLPVTGAMGLNISKQYRPGDWDWVIINGGGNDLWFGCGCVACEGTIDALISKDGRRGKIPDLVHKIRGKGARAIFVGYLHSPGVFSIVDHCKSEDVEFERRVASLAARTHGFYYLNVSDLAGKGDRSFHSADRIHPSVKGSRAVARLIANLIAEEGS